MTTPKPTAREQALKLIGDLSRASIQAYKAVNEGKSFRGVQCEKICLKEEKAAMKLFKALTGEDASETEIQEAISL